MIKVYDNETNALRASFGDNYVDRIENVVEKKKKYTDQYVRVFYMLGDKQRVGVFDKCYYVIE